MSLISVKFAIRRSLLQFSFQGQEYSTLSPERLSLSFLWVGEDPRNEVVFTAESNQVQSYYKSGKILSSSPENRYWAMTADK